MKIHVDIKRHAFGDLTVLEDVNFTVKDGEIVSIIGPSGCGKSTLLGIAGGILRATDGRVSLEGAVPPDCLNPVTYIFQDFALLPWRTVADNVALPLEQHKFDPVERKHRIATVLRSTGLTEFADAYPKQLSGGMKQRVGIARALVVRPAVLLMDEPLSALDAQTRELLMDEFLDLLLKEKIVSIYVTHNFQEALRLSDRVIVLSRRPGRIKAVLDLTIPQRERHTPKAQFEMAGLSEQLWSLIRDEASTADREVFNG